MSLLSFEHGGAAVKGAAIDNGEWYARWRDLPDEARMPFRTYTVRRIDPEALELDIDFVLHHDAGPAGAWAEAATIGDRILVVGPDAHVVSALTRVLPGRSGLVGRLTSRLDS